MPIYGNVNGLNEVFLESLSENAANLTLALILPPSKPYTTKQPLPIKLDQKKKKKKAKEGSQDERRRRRGEKRDIRALMFKA